MAAAGSMREWSNWVTREEVRAQALQEGAVAVLFKPFSDTALLDALNAGLEAD